MTITQVAALLAVGVTTSTTTSALLRAALAARAAGRTAAPWSPVVPGDSRAAGVPETISTSPATASRVVPRGRPAATATTTPVRPARVARSPVPRCPARVGTRPRSPLAGPGPGATAADPGAGRVVPAALRPAARGGGGPPAG